RTRKFKMFFLDAKGIFSRARRRYPDGMDLPLTLRGISKARLGSS
ncbi:hypothetical protein LCGC14_0688830, partial [marine sediment metagenome]